MKDGNPDRGERRSRPREDHVFIVRLWVERPSGGAQSAPLWRGRVKYLNRDEEVHVDGIDAALEALRTTLQQY